LAVALAAAGARVVAIVVGERPYPAREIAASLGIMVAGVVPHDPSGVAKALAGVNLRRARSSVASSCAVLGATLTALVDADDALDARATALKEQV
jgi:hypothetical protein